MLVYVLVVFVFCVTVKAQLDCKSSLTPLSGQKVQLLVEVQVNQGDNFFSEIIKHANSSLYVAKFIACNCAQVDPIYAELCSVISATLKPTGAPRTRLPTKLPTRRTKRPSKYPTSRRPTKYPTKRPRTKRPTSVPSTSPEEEEYEYETEYETYPPLALPTVQPTTSPETEVPTVSPSLQPTTSPVSVVPTTSPTTMPSSSPVKALPTTSPSFSPSLRQTNRPSSIPTRSPSRKPTSFTPSHSPLKPTHSPTVKTSSPFTLVPTSSPRQVFEIDIAYYTSGFPDKYKAVVQQAADNWASIILNDFPSSFDVRGGDVFCGSLRVVVPYAIHVENILMLIGITPIDNAGKVIARAGVCAFDSRGKPRVAVIIFDSADVETMYLDQRLYSITRHELGHALGVGTSWGGLVSGSYTYLGANGNQGNLLVGGSGPAVVEDSGGQGTAGAHWKESLYQNELMTGWAQPPGQQMPLSLLTVKSLQDLGYEVDETKADPYVIPAGRRRMRETLIAGMERALRGPAQFGCEVISMDESVVVKTKQKRHGNRKKHV